MARILNLAELQDARDQLAELRRLLTDLRELAGSRYSAGLVPLDIGRAVSEVKAAERSLGRAHRHAALEEPSVVREELELYTLAEVAELCHVSKRTVERRLAEGSVPYVTIGGRRRIRALDARRLVAAGLDGKT